MIHNGTLNKVILIGNIGSDIRVNYFDSKSCVGNFSLATSETYLNDEKQKVTITEWHNIVVKNKLAETMEQYLKKGDKVYLEGRIRTRKWINKEGVEKKNTEIIVHDFTFLPNPK